MANKLSSLPTGAKAQSRVPSPGAPPPVQTAGVRKTRPMNFTPKPASTRMYGKAEPAATAPGFFPGAMDV